MLNPYLAIVTVVSHPALTEGQAPSLFELSHRNHQRE